MVSTLVMMLGVALLNSNCTSNGSEANGIPGSQISIPFVTIVDRGETGTFLMGSTESEIATQPTFDHFDYYTHDELPAHNVDLTVPYEMSKFEITNEQFALVMNWAIDGGKARVSNGDLTDVSGSTVYMGIANLVEEEHLGVQYGMSVSGNHIEPASHSRDHPAHAVTWYGAVAFCNFLSEMQGLEPVFDLSDWTWDTAKNGHRLPTEAEWEYAARKDERFTFAWGNDIDGTYLNYGYSEKPFRTVTTPVGFYDGVSKEGIDTKDNASPSGLYDMTGNVWEWCWDWYRRDYYGESPQIDPMGPDSGDDRPPYHVNEPTKVWRGCGWAGNDGFSRVAKRWSASPDLAINEVGFRIARTLR